MKHRVMRPYSRQPELRRSPSALKSRAFGSSSAVRELALSTPAATRILGFTPRVSPPDALGSMDPTLSRRPPSSVASTGIAAASRGSASPWRSRQQREISAADSAGPSPPALPD